MSARHRGMAMKSSDYLGDAIEGFIADAVRAGRFASRDAMLRYGIRPILECEDSRSRFEAEIQKAIDNHDRCERILPDGAFGRLEQRYREVAGRNSA